MLQLAVPEGLADQLMLTVGALAVASDDPTGIGDALARVAGLLAGIAGGLTALALVVLGFLYVTSMDDVGRAIHLRRAVGALLAGLVLILLGTTIAPHLVQAITGH
jgi:hypothetical protein